MFISYTQPEGRFEATGTLAAKPDWYVEVHSGLGLEANGGSPEQIVELFRDAGYTLCIKSR